MESKIQRIYSIAVFPIILVWFYGCSAKPSSEHLLLDYLARLERVLKIERPISEPLSPPRLPPKRELSVSIERPQVDFLDYWAYRRCGLAPIIAERNSILGKVMVPSENLLLDGKMILQLEFCRDLFQSEGEKQLVELTEDFLTQKYQQFPLYYWNASVASPELRSFWSTTAAPLETKRDENFSDAISALYFLADLPNALSDKRWPKREQLQMQYRQLEQYKLGGRLLVSLSLSIAYIDMGNTILQQAKETQSLCPHGLQPRQIQYAKNIMREVYAGRIQSWFAKLNRYSIELINAHNTLIEKQDSYLTLKTADFSSAIEALYDDFKHANQKHVRLWKELFESCGERALD